MREIEFRAWLKREKKMVDVKAIDWDDKGNIICINYPQGKSYSGYDGDNIELMQSSGLRDKTRTKEYPEGKKIFEGDIVRYYNKRKIFEIRYIKELASFMLVNLDEISFPIEKDDELRMEVIGNIYENKELLENV